MEPFKHGNGQEKEDDFPELVYDLHEFVSLTCSPQQESTLSHSRTHICRVVPHVFCGNVVEVPEVLEALRESWFEGFCGGTSRVQSNFAGTVRDRLHNLAEKLKRGFEICLFGGGIADGRPKFGNPVGN